MIYGELSEVSLCTLPFSLQVPRSQAGHQYTGTEHVDQSTWRGPRAKFKFEIRTKLSTPILMIMYVAVLTLGRVECLPSGGPAEF
jgi:hypothetical protein